LNYRHVLRDADLLWSSVMDDNRSILPWNERCFAELIRRSENFNYHPYIP